MYKILRKEVFSETVKLMVLEAPLVAHKAKPGQFVIVRIDETGERIPLTIADFDAVAGTVTIIFQEVGKSTMQMGLLEEGSFFENVVGPLGHPTEIKNYGKVIVVAGGVGIAPIFPIARALKQAGNHVTAIVGARSQSLLFWEDRMRAETDELIICTDDGCNVVSGLFEGARNWEDGRNAHASRDDDHFAVIFDFGGVPQGTDHVFEVVAFLQQPHLHGRFAHFLKDDGDRAFFDIKVCNGQGDAFACFIYADNDELPGFCFMRNERRVENHQFNGFAKNFFSEDFVHGGVFLVLNR